MLRSFDLGTLGRRRSTVGESAACCPARWRDLGRWETSELAVTVDVPLLTTRRIRNVEAIVEASEARADDQTLHYAPRDFVLVGLPYKRPKDRSVFERRNGSFRFRVVGDPAYGVPFGQDRLLTFWLASAYQAQGCPEHRTIVFRSAADILRTYDIDPAGLQYTRLRERVERVFAATYFAYDESPGAGLSSEMREGHRRDGTLVRHSDALRAQRYQLIERVQLWFFRRQTVNQHTLWQNAIKLSPEFARDVKDNAIPVDLETVRALKDKPAALDLYVWQAWRSWRVANVKRGSLRIPLRGPAGLLAQLGTEAKRERKQLELVHRCQDLIKRVWPSCPNTIEGDLFVVRAARAVRRASLELPGVTNPPRGAGSVHPGDARGDELIVRER